MANLEATLPLQDFAAEEAQAAQAAGVEIRQLDIAEKLLLRGTGTDNFQRAVSDVLGHEIPEAPNVVSGDDLYCLCLSDSEWLVLSSREKPLEKPLNDALNRQVAAVIDVSSAWTIVEVAGANAEALLASGCSLDLHESSFPVGQCARGLISHVEIVIYRRETADGYHILVDRSLAADLWNWLHGAAAELASVKS